MDELDWLKRVLLELEVSVCDCGDPWKESDLYDMVKLRIDQVERDRVIEAQEISSAKTRLKELERGL